jgi:lipopolysaccharide export system permease protein
MKLLQRYILFELLRVFALLLSVLTVLLVFVGIFREVSESGLGPMQAMQILPYIVPSLMPFTIPATLLLAVCVVYGRIAGDQEVTAAKAAGINVMSLLWPALLLGASLSLFSLLLSDRIIPWAMNNIQRTIALAMEDIFLDLLKSNHQVTDRRRGISVTVMGVEGKTLIMPTFQYAPIGRSPITIQAQTATMDFDLERQEVVLHLTHGHVDTPGGKVWFDEEADRRFPLQTEKTKPKPRHMSIETLQKEMRVSQKELEVSNERRDMEVAMALAVGNYKRFTEVPFLFVERHPKYKLEDIAKIRTEVHSRFAMSSSCLFFALVGAPFSILQARRQFLTSFFLCFVPILLIYYPVVLLAMNLSKLQMVDPSWAMWLANGIVLIVGVHILWRVLKH